MSEGAVDIESFEADHIVEVNLLSSVQIIIAGDDLNFLYVLNATDFIGVKTFAEIKYSVGLDCE